MGAGLNDGPWWPPPDTGARQVLSAVAAFTERADRVNKQTPSEQHPCTVHGDSWGLLAAVKLAALCAYFQGESCVAVPVLCCVPTVHQGDALPNWSNDDRTNSLNRVVKRETDRQTETEIHRMADTETERERERQTDRQTETDGDRHRNRHRDRQRDRQTESNSERSVDVYQFLGSKVKIKDFFFNNRTLTS